MVEKRNASRKELAVPALRAVTFGSNNDGFGYLYSDDNGDHVRSEFDRGDVLLALLNGEDGVESKDGDLYLEFEDKIPENDSEVRSLIE